MELENNNNNLKLIRTEKMKVKLKCMLLALMVCLTGIIYAQESHDGIKFVEDKTFNQALDLAKKENKLLFIDCYTYW